MEKKVVKKDRRQYDDDFKKQVLKLVESGRPVAEVAESLGVAAYLIYSWKKQLNKKKGISKIDTEIVFDDDKLALQKRVQQLEMERDILKKALGIFSR